MNMVRTTVLAVTMLGALGMGAVAPAAAANTENTSIALPALAINFLPVYVAKDKGYWKNLGLNVTLHQITGIGATNAMLAGSVDFAVQSGETLIRGDIRGRHMLGVALMNDGVAFQLVARKQSLGGLDLQAPLAKRIAVLKGKQVSVDAPNTIPDGFLRFLIAKAGLNPQRDITEVYMSSTEAIAALKSGTTAAALLNFPWTETAQREGAVVLASGIADVPELLPTISTTTTARAGFCSHHASICAKLAHGYVLAHKFIHDHPSQALKIGLKRMVHASIADLQKSMPAILKTTPLVPRYSKAGCGHDQKLMVIAGMMHKDEVRKSCAGMYSNKYVDMFAKSGK